MFRNAGMLSNRTDMKCLEGFFFHLALKLTYFMCKTEVR